MNVDYDKLYETTEFTLSKEEESVYRYVCLEFGIDPDARLDGRRLTISPFHQVQLIAVFAHVSAQQLQEQLFIDDDHPTMILKRMMQKSAKALHEADLNEAADEFATVVEEDDELVGMAQGGELTSALEPRYPHDA